MKKITNKRAIEILVKNIHLSIIDEGDKYWEAINLYITNSIAMGKDFYDLKEWLLQKGVRIELI